MNAPHQFDVLSFVKLYEFPLIEKKFNGKREGGGGGGGGWVGEIKKTSKRNNEKNTIHNMKD